MKYNKKYRGSYLVGILLVLLFLKVVLTMFFVQSKEALFPICFQSQTALAAEKVGQRKIEKNSAESIFKKQDQNSQKEDVVSIFIIEKERSGLEMERKSMQREREQLRALQKEIDKKLIELSKLQDNIQETVAKKSAAHEQKIKHLIKVYTSMAPKKAAVLIEKIDIDIIIEVFSKMKGDSVGKILSYVKPTKAAVISECLVKR